MSTVNPYSPPRAHVADVEDTSLDVQDIRIWSARGRLGRLRFLAYGLVGYLVMVLLGGALTALGGSIHPALGGIGMAIAVIAYAVFTCLISIQRAHDMGWSGWTMPLVLVPLVGLIWIFNGGTRGANRFGAPPPPNTWGVRVLAFVMPVVAVIGILAAIAIPAYQDYTVRARAAGAAK